MPRWLKILLITALSLLAALLVVLLLAGNFLFEFALYPDGVFTMSDLFARGNVAGTGDGPDTPLTDEVRQWQEYAADAADWFDAQGEQVELSAEDGSVRRGRMFTRQEHKCAILFHGYAGASWQMAPYARMFYDMGFTALTPDALAHGDSDGKYIGMGWLERSDVLGWIRLLTDEDPQARILLFGVSMGGATVMMAAGEELPENVKCIVEDCGYSSVWEEFSLQLKNIFHMPTFPLLNTASLFSKLRAGYSFGEASAVEQLGRARVPMLFIHGEEDTFVPYEMLDTVYDACASPVKEKLTVPGAGHGAAVGTDPVLYWNTVIDFVQRFVE